MGELRRAREIDGFSAVTAVKHARKDGSHVARSPAPPPEVQREEPRKPQRAARFGRTAVPTKHETYCYECGYAFTVAGRVRVLICHHCKCVLNQEDFTMTTDFNETLKTTGTVTIPPGAVMKGGLVAARDVVLAGSVQGGEVRALRCLDVRPGAVFDPARTSSQDLKLAAGVELRIPGHVNFRNMDIAGTLAGDMEASGLVHVSAEGSFTGSLRTSRLQVDEGGGLAADVNCPAGEAESGVGDISVSPIESG